MKWVLFTLQLLLVIFSVFSQEVKTEKNRKWQVTINYARLFNYRYAKLPDNLFDYPLDPTLSHQLANVDTGNIAINSNLIGLMIQRKIWKFINIQTGVTISRRGYLGTYVRRQNFYGTYNEIQIIPRKKIYLPIMVNFSFTIKKKLQLQFGLGKEISVFVFKEKVYFPTTLEKSSAGFFGYKWDKTRKLNQETQINAQYGSGQGLYNLFTTSIGYKINPALLLSILGNYSVTPQYYNIKYDSGLTNINLLYNYEVKPYYLGLGISISYCF